jgi:ABC-type uncharacterized transport system permease subunit
LTLGAIAGAVVGEVYQEVRSVPGWGVVGGAAGFVVGLVLFLLRSDS